MSEISTTTTTTSFEEIWQLFRQVAEESKETNRCFQETQRRFQETDSRFQETERILKELSRDTDRKLREVSRDIGRLGNRLGDFIEESVRPAAVRLFTQLGIAVTEVHQNVTAKRNGMVMEIDLLVVDTTTLVAIECKSNLDQEDVQNHLQRLGKLKAAFPRYADYRVLGAVAAMVIPDKIAEYAYQHGLYIIGPSGEDLYIRNDEKFVPKEW